jgi:hypothetical protein
MVVYTAADSIEDILLSFTLLHTKYLSEALTERECIQLETFAAHIDYNGMRSIAVV